MKEYLEKMIGEPIAVLCARYWYRGILRSVSDTAIVLDNPKAVESTGSATASAPVQEDTIPSPLCISIGAVEITCQPTWVWSGYDVKGEIK